MNRKIELAIDKLNNSNYEVGIEGKKYMIIPCSVFDETCELIHKEAGNNEEEDPTWEYKFKVKDLELKIYKSKAKLETAGYTWCQHEKLVKKQKMYAKRLKELKRGCRTR